MSITVKDFEGLMDLLKLKFEEVHASLIETNHMLVKVLELSIKVADENMKAALDENNKSRYFYWEGYLEAVVEMKRIIEGAI